jgi:small-conductance mechanosensitive channel
MKTIFQLLECLDLLPKKVRITLYIMATIIIMLLCLVGYLFTAIHLQNDYIDWLDYRINKGLFIRQ